MFTKCALEGDDTGRLDKSLGDFTLPFDEEYKQLLLDDTKLKAGRRKSKPGQQTASGTAPGTASGAAPVPEAKAGIVGKERKKKHKKKPMPKNVDTTQPPDPERWLPKWKRAKYRKQFKRYGKFRETQGDVVTTTALGACIR